MYHTNMARPTKTTAQIDRFDAQDAYWYADCVARGGEGEQFQLRSSGYKSLMEMWQQGYRKAVKGGIDLSGMSLKGSLADRAKRLMDAVESQSWAQAIDAQRGETVACCERDDPGYYLASIMKYRPTYLTPEITAGWPVELRAAVLALVAGQAVAA